MTIFEDFLSKGNLYQRLKKESLICKAFQETHIKTLYEYGWYDELFDSGEPNFKELEQLPIYVVLIDEYKTEIIQNLIEEYKPLTKIKENGHFFDFLVINAELKLICGLGLGRKNTHVADTACHPPLEGASKGIEARGAGMIAPLA